LLANRLCAEVEQLRRVARERTVVLLDYETTETSRIIRVRCRTPR